MKVQWKNEKELLEHLINEKISYEEIGRRYGVSGAAVKKAAKKLGIEISPRREINPCEIRETTRQTHICLNCGKEFEHRPSSKNIYCSNACQQEYMHKKRWEKFLRKDPDIQRPNYSPHIFKKDIIKEQGGKCAICGISEEWNGKPLVFIIDHIDGNASNNTRENLRCVCPNCDSQLPTYKSKNKNGARYYYRYGNKK